MGKKSKEPNQETSVSIKSLFSENNPFRRKSEPEPHQSPPPPPPPELGLGLPNDTEADARKRKRDTKLGSPSPTESIPKKMKKLENDKDIGEVLKSKKKRKIDELEAEHAIRNYGEIVEKEEVLVNVGEKRKVKEDDVVVSKEEEKGYDDESKLLRTIFVGNLPVKIKKKVLMKEFERFGKIESARIRSVPLIDTKTPRKGAIIKGLINEAVGRVNAYIVFKDEQSAKDALSLNMSMIGENHVRVDMACPPSKKCKRETQLYERKKTVFVGNVPFDVQDEELYELFCGYNGMESSVEAIRVVRDHQTSIGKGIAYVLFKSRDAANTVVRRGGLTIRNRELRVCHARADTTPAMKVDESRWDVRKRKFAEIGGERSSGNSNSLSYQGVRSSKSGAVKKSGSSHSRPFGGNENRGTKRAGGGVEAKGQKGKRPAVASRKLKELAMKRRMQSGGTREGSYRNKKAKVH